MHNYEPKQGLNFQGPIRAKAHRPFQISIISSCFCFRICIKVIIGFYFHLLSLSLSPLFLVGLSFSITRPYSSLAVVALPLPLLLLVDPPPSNHLYRQVLLCRFMYCPSYLFRCPSFSFLVLIPVSRIQSFAYNIISEVSFSFECCFLSTHVALYRGFYLFILLIGLLASLFKCTICI